MKEFIPKHKSDTDAVSKLKNYFVEEIKDDVPLLLEWLQDMNWPVAVGVRDYLSNHINKIDEEIIAILKTTDEVWKYWIIDGLLACSVIIPNEKILAEIIRIAENPTKEEIHEEVQEVAINLLNILRNDSL